MKFFAFLALFVAAASAQAAQDRSERLLLGVISSILESLQKPPVDFGPAIVEEPISVGPGIVDSLVPIAVGPAIVEDFAPIVVGPAVVDEYVPIAVGPAIVEEAPAVSSPAPSLPWSGSSPLVQIILNVNGAQSGSIVGSPVTVEGLPSPSPAVVAEPINPTPVTVVESEINPSPVVVVDPIVPTPVIVEEIVPEPVVIGTPTLPEIIPAPAAILPEELN